MTRRYEDFREDDAFDEGARRAQNSGAVGNARRNDPIAA